MLNGFAYFIIKKRIFCDHFFVILFIYLHIIKHYMLWETLLSKSYPNYAKMDN